MRKLLAILFLFPLLCFGQGSKTPLNRAFLQSNMDGNQLSITNLNLINSGFSDVATNFLNTYVAPSWGRAVGVLGQQQDGDGKPSGQFLLLSIGDSVASETSASLAMSLFPMIYRAHGRNGTELVSAGNTHRIWFLGTVQPMVPDNFWFGGYYAVNNASSVTWSNDFNSQGNFCNYVNVYFIRHPGGGNFRVQAGVNGGAFADIGTLAGFNATAIGGFTNITFAQSMNQFRIVSDASTNYIIGIGDGFSGAQQGFVTAAMFYPGIATANVTNVPRAIRDVILTNLFRNKLGGIILAHMKEDGTPGTAAGIHEMNNWFNLTTNQGVATVWVGTSPVSADTNTTPPYTLGQNILVKSDAQPSDISYFDGYKYFGSYPQMLADGFNTDGTHPSAAANDLMAQGFMKEFGLNNTITGNDWERGPIKIGYDGYATAGNSAYPTAPLTVSYRAATGNSITYIADGIRFIGTPLGQNSGDSNWAIQGDVNYLYLNAPNGSGGINFSANQIPRTLGRAHISGGWSLGGVVADPGLGNVSVIGFLGVGKGANVSSASTITPSSAIFHVTGTTTINTINLPWTGFTGSIYIIPDGVFATGTSGNIQIASTAVVSKQLIMTYDGTKWYPSY